MINNGTVTLSMMSSYSGKIGVLTIILMSVILVTIIAMIVWRKSFPYGLGITSIVLVIYFLAKWVAVREIEVAEGGGYYILWTCKIIGFFLISILIGWLMDNLGIIYKIKKWLI